MPSRDEAELLKRLRDTFRVEAVEHAQAIASGLLQLERLPPAEVAAGAVDPVFRAAHSLKGAARAVSAGGIESLCQSLESVFAALRSRSVAPSASLFDLLHCAAEAVARAVALLDDDPSATIPEAAGLRRALQAALAQPTNVMPDEPSRPESATSPPLTRGGGDTVRVQQHRIDAALLQAEELVFAKAAVTQRAETLRRLHASPAKWRRAWTGLRADLRAVSSAFGPGAPASAAARASWRRLQEYVEASQDVAASLDTELLNLSRAAERDRRAVAAMVDQLLDEMKQVTVQPFSTVLDLFPVMVRELSRDRGKDVELVVTGADIQIDRRILDAVKDPLIHLVRNSVDHGIEPPAVRRAKGKPARGRLWIEVRPSEGHELEVKVRDDGAGIDADALHRAAEQAGVRRAGAPSASSPEDLLWLACESGVSTSPIITDLSGRGLGLSIVKEQVERLTGTLYLESAPDAGTTFRLRLPLTLARFRGVVVRAGRQRFVLPTRNVQRVARVREEQVKMVGNRATIALGGRAMGLARLALILDLKTDAHAQGEDDAVFPVVVLGQDARSVAFRVDEVIDELEVLAKPLGPQLERVRHYAGASVIAGGALVPILHAPDLLESAVRLADSAGAAAASAGPSGTTGKTILVAEDSITSRTLLKGILESAGYRVETAADGIDAYAALRSGHFDLLVSDVDMPRMNGFGLAAKVRADRKLADLPVVLVTALESPEDREHGIDVGASAYLVKSSFDQGNLLDVVGRLL